MEAEDLLSLIIGALVVDTIIIGMNYGRVIFVSDQLTRWYTTCRISAMAMDILIIVLYATIGMRISRALGTHELASIVGVQVLGDILFYAFFKSIPRGTVVFDIFKDYAVEVGFHALWADAVMMIGTYGIARGIHVASMDTKALSLIMGLYVSQYVLYLK